MSNVCRTAEPRSEEGRKEHGTAGPHVCKRKCPSPVSVTVLRFLVLDARCSALSGCTRAQSRIHTRTGWSLENNPRAELGGDGTRNHWWVVDQCQMGRRHARGTRKRLLAAARRAAAAERERVPSLTNVRLQHSVMIWGRCGAPVLCCASPTGFGSSACLIRGSGLSFYLAASSQETRGHGLA